VTNGERLLVTQHHNQLGLPLFFPHTSKHPSHSFSPFLDIRRSHCTCYLINSLALSSSSPAAMSFKASPHARQKPEQKPATTPSSSNIKQSEGTCNHTPINDSNTEAATSTLSPSSPLSLPSANYTSSSSSGPSPLSPYTNLSRDLKTNEMVFGPIPDREYHEGFMRKAIEMAQLALRSDETPVGCVFVKDGEVIGRGINGTNASLNVSIGKNISSSPFNFSQSPRKSTLIEQKNRALATPNSSLSARSCLATTRPSCTLPTST
jgi:tRNA-specific adenosine deaminase 2